MNILVGVTGGIAAYKTATLVRELKKSGHDVKVIMTDDAKNFITPLTLATLSGNPVYVENFNPENGAWNSHISLGTWAELFVVAPATANTIAKMANGIADNLLLTTYLSARCPVWIAPAMDLDMYAHPTTQKNLEYLRLLRVNIIEPTEGFLASGLTGKGRMAEPEEIVRQILTAQTIHTQDFKNVDVLITAGGTVENIDPVRFISNYSSGKMGVALAHNLAQRGAKVTLVKANCSVTIPVNENIVVVDAMSASAMYEAVNDRFAKCQVAIFAAAVADYAPRVHASHKIKHSSENFTLELVPTKDIAAEMGKRKNKQQLCIGFALETDNEGENARKKLESKNFDAIILNSMQDKGAGFCGDTNKITIISHKETLEYPLKSKELVAKDINDYIRTLL